MQRLVTLSLAVALSGWAAMAQGPAVNLALGRPYVSNAPVLPGWTGLVDGDRESDSAPACFATANSPEYPKHVTIDLGGQCTITKVVVYNSGNGNTRTVSLAASADAQTYKLLREPDFIFADRDPLFLSVAFQPRVARYIRITFRDTWKGGLGGDNCLFLREVEVYGQAGKEMRDDPLKLAATQPLFETDRAVSIFRRYCLEQPGDLDIAVIGDLTVIDADKEGHWATVAANALRRFYPDKRLTVEIAGGTSGSIAYGLEWAQERRGSLAPDLVLLSYGAQAAAAKADVNEFRVKYQGLVNELLTHTAALVVAITPPPYLSSAAGATGEDAERGTWPYAWAVEQVAQSQQLPLVRTASVLARVTDAPDRASLLLDSQHLGGAGHQALGIAIADLLR